MPRPLVAICLAALVCAPAASADPTPIDRALALQIAIADARDLLTAHKPADAIALLEKNLPHADGSRAFLDLLRSAYAAEVKRLQIANADPAKVADLRTKLMLIGGSAELGTVTAAVVKAEPVAVTPPPPVAAPALDPAPSAALDSLRQAADLFNQGKAQPRKLELAAKLFAAACGGGVELSPEHHAAWAYCRIRIAAERLNAHPSHPAVAGEVVAEVEEAAKHAPGNAGLQKVAAELVAVAKARAGNAVAAAGDVIETASFLVRHGGNKELGEAIARAAEAKRGEISARWSGPPGGVWEPKCEIVVHPDAATFAKATGQPETATGRAVVKLDGGQAVERRLDLRADDATAADDALPRELTHVVLADLFPTHAPPRWAEAGMAALAASPTERDRCLRTAIRCHRDGELVSAGKLLEAGVPAGQVTGWYAGSVSLVDFLVKWKGEKAFTTFLRDSQRYGQKQAIQRQYGVADLRELEEAWARGALSTTRGQTP
jgi:hypothetical protein